MITVAPFLKKATPRILLIAGTALLLYAPTIYLNRFSPLGPDEAVICRNEAAEGHAEADVADVASGQQGEGTKVKLYGRVAYAPASEIFRLRDGVFSVPLTFSGCDETDLLKGAEVPVFVKGTVARQDGQTYIAVDGIKQSFPAWSQTAFNAGFWGLIGVFAAAVIGFFSLLRTLLAMIGFKRRQKEPPSPEEIAERKAGASLLAGVLAPFAWSTNPIIGVVLHVSGLLAGRHGLRSKKRTVAIAGLTLCVAGLVGMPLAFGAEGLYGKAPEPNVAKYLIENGFKDEAALEAHFGPAGPLESEPNVN